MIYILRSIPKSTAKSIDLVLTTLSSILRVIYMTISFSF
nr:MAG TPA: hypothetical protein [Bacteriophage sp.]